MSIFCVARIDAVHAFSFRAVLLGLCLALPLAATSITMAGQRCDENTIHYSALPSPERMTAAQTVPTEDAMRIETYGDGMWLPEGFHVRHLD